MAIRHPASSSLSSASLVPVLRYVDCKHRVRACSLVCSSWRAAVAESLFEEFSLDLTSPTTRSQVQDKAKRSGFLSFMSANVAHMTHVQLKLPGPLLQQVWQQLQQHSSQLQHLHLEADDVVELEPWAEIGSAVQLTNLSFQHCTLPDWAVLAQLPALQQLHLGDVMPAVPATTPSWELWSVRSELYTQRFPCIPAMQHLTQLVLGQMPIAAAGPSLTQLTSLQHLELQECLEDIPHGVLADLTQLQHLHLSMKPRDSAAGAPPAGQISSGLLLEVAALQQLTSLTVRIDDIHAPTTVYSALTASSCLQRLQIDLAVNTFRWMSNGALLLDVFPNERMLPQLQHVSLPDVSRLFDGAVLKRLCCCCPALQHLSVSFQPCYYPTIMGVGKLSQLTTLTGLSICNPTVDWVVWEVAEITQLRHLELRNCQGSALVLQLNIYNMCRLLRTRLTRLSQLSVSGQLTDDRTNTQETVVLTTGRNDRHRDMWTELLKCCGRSRNQTL